MRPDTAFVAARPAAQHCPDLLRGGAAQPAASGEQAGRMALAGERLARALSAGLSRFAGGDAPEVTVGRACAQDMAELARAIAPLAANSLLGIGVKAHPLLVSIEAGVVLRLVDRAFGGRGVMPEPLPRAFPASAELLIERLETIVAEALARAFGLADSDAIRPLRRDGSLAQTHAFAPDEPLTVMALQVVEASGDAWAITVALPAPALAALVEGATGGGARDRRVARLPGAAETVAGPAGELPLTLRAVLVDMRVPFARVSTLRPGDVLPVAVARSVPLRVGARTIAHGTVGALDDRVAVQLTQAFA